MVMVASLSQFSIDGENDLAEMLRLHHVGVRRVDVVQRVRAVNGPADAGGFTAFIVRAIGGTCRCLGL
jgi:hypothetical protein